LAGIWVCLVKEIARKRYLEFLVYHLALKLGESAEKRLAGREIKVGQYNLRTICTSVEKRVSYITRPDLHPSDPWNVQWLVAVWLHKPQVDSW
jgi:hypothetical protein